MGYKVLILRSTTVVKSQEGLTTELSSYWGRRNGQLRESSNSNITAGNVLVTAVPLENVTAPNYPFEKDTCQPMLPIFITSPSLYGIVAVSHWSEFTN